MEPRTGCVQTLDLGAHDEPNLPFVGDMLGDLCDFQLRVCLHGTDVTDQATQHDMWTSDADACIAPFTWKHQNQTRAEQ